MAARIGRLETAVFGITASESVSSEPPGQLTALRQVLQQLVMQLLPVRQQVPSRDSWVLQFVLPSGEDQALTACASSFSQLQREEHDDEVARLCRALSSPQRIGLLKQLCQRSLTSGELVEISGMSGGHLHHHLRDLLNLTLVEKIQDGHYRATTAGTNAYLTIAALHRCLSYGQRAAFHDSLATLADDLPSGGE